MQIEVESVLSSYNWQQSTGHANTDGAGRHVKLNRLSKVLSVKAMLQCGLLVYFLSSIYYRS